MAEMARITPMVPVTNLDKSISFFENVLGFKATYRQENYAFLRRDAIGIRMLEAAPGTDLSDPRRQVACYIDVLGLDDLYAELKSQLDALPKGRVRPPFTQDYGQREFHVIDEDALLIFFGEPI
ncbi:MAG: VOC family protein [Pseudomonadota bacterium]